MNFAKLCLILTACVLSACTSHLQPTQELHRLEAVKARLNLALAYLEQQDYPKTKLNIDRAIKHDPNDYLPYSVLAYYYQTTQDHSKAENAYQQADSLENIVKCAQKAGNNDKAKMALSALEKVDLNRANQMK